MSAEIKKAVEDGVKAALEKYAIDPKTHADHHFKLGLLFHTLNKASNPLIVSIIAIGIFGFVLMAGIFYKSGGKFG